MERGGDQRAGPDRLSGSEGRGSPVDRRGAKAGHRARTGGRILAGFPGFRGDRLLALIIAAARDQCHSRGPFRRGLDGWWRLPAEAEWTAIPGARIWLANHRDAKRACPSPRSAEAQHRSPAQGRDRMQGAVLLIILTGMPPMPLAHGRTFPKTLAQDQSLDGPVTSGPTAEHPAGVRSGRSSYTAAASAAWGPYRCNRLTSSQIGDGAK
jgi:hypothetical protein